MANRELTQLAASKQVPVPRSLDVKHAAGEILSGLSGEEFDLAYVKNQVAGHICSYALVECYAKKGGDPDRVAAGEVPALPIRAGFYTVVAVKRGTGTGNIAILFDDDPAGASGFVHLGPGASGNPIGPLVGLNFDIDMGRGWHYENED